MAATATSIRERSSNPLGYFILAFAFTWAFWWLTVFEERDLIEFPLPAVFRGAFGPGLAVVAAWQQGGAGVRSLLGRIAR